MRNCDPARIFDRIEKTESGCWLYTGGIQKGGYGVISIKNKSVQTHRVSYELRVGSIPEGMCVLHRCDVRRCINPEHLFLGTLGDNNTDRKQKGRNTDRRGERNPQAKADTEKIRKLREAHATRRYSQRQLAKMFGLCQQQVSVIVRGKAWSHVPDPVTDPVSDWSDDDTRL